MDELENSVVNTHAQVRAEQMEIHGAPEAEVTKAPELTEEEKRGLQVKFDQDAAIQITIQDAERADRYIAEKWGLIWRECDILEQSPRSIQAWAQPTMTRANVSRFVVGRLKNSVGPKITSALFYEKPPIELRPRFSTGQKYTRAKKALLGAYLDEDWEQEIALGVEEFSLMGTVIFFWGVDIRTKTRVKVRKKAEAIKTDSPAGSTTVHTRASDEWETVETTTTAVKPWLRMEPLEYVLTDPNWNKPDIRDRSCKWVERRLYLDFYELEELREDPHYALPSTEELKTWFFPPSAQAAPPGSTEQMLAQSGSGLAGVVHSQPRYMDSSADPLLHKQQVLERWTDEHCYVVVLLDHHPGQPKLIRGPGKGATNGENPFGVKPCLSANFWNIRNSGYGFGIGRINGQDQRIETGTTNALLDIISFLSNPDYLIPRGSNAPTQPIYSRLGGIIKTDVPPEHIKSAMVLKELPKADPALFQMLQVVKGEEESAIGANEQMVQGGGSARTSLYRTAGGAGIANAAVQSRIQAPLDRIVKQVIIPYIYQLDENIRRYVPAAEIREILGDELKKDMDALDVVNADFGYDVLAGAKLAARQATAQIMPLLIQIVQAPNFLQQVAQINQVVVDPLALIKRLLDVTAGGPVQDIFRPMTPQEKQRAGQANPAAAKLQGQVQLEGVKQKGALETIEAKSEATAADRVLVKALEHATETEALTGAPAAGEIGGSA